jgi:hypothetical protein
MLHIVLLTGALAAPARKTQGGGSITARLCSATVPANGSMALRYRLRARP